MWKESHKFLPTYFRDLPYVHRRGVQYAKFSYQGIGVTIRYNLYHDMYVRTCTVKHFEKVSRVRSVNIMCMPEEERCHDAISNRTCVHQICLGG